MLEKHLQHLKKGGEGGDPMGPPASASSLSHRSAGQSLKDESSPAGSPSTMNNSNWNSPAQFGNMSAPTSATFPPQMQGGSMGQAGFVPMGAPMGMGGNGPLPGHRRHVSDMTGGPEDMSDPKRQRMYQQQGGQMQGGQHMGGMQSMSAMGRGPNG